MPDILDHVEFLSQQVGPRPAGTEEEQQAALYITEQIQKEAGLSAVIEDFNSPTNDELPRAICIAVTLVATILSLFLSVLVIPALILTLISAGIVAAETFGRPIISPLFARGVSQNVVAKYEPGFSPEAGGSRRRKVILVARYDSGKVRTELNGPLLGIMPILNWVGFGGLAAVPVLLLIKALFFLHATGVAAVIMTVLLVIALVAAAIPLVFTVMHKFAAYNEGANANAAGVAALIEVANRIGRGRVSEEELSTRESTATVHGEEAARAAGLVPEGAQLVYEAASLTPPDPAPQSQAERLAAAKAAVAALTGKPVNMHSSLDISNNLVQVKEPPLPKDPSEHDLIESRDETREALTSLPAETVQDALEHAAAVTDVPDAAAAAVAPVADAASSVFAAAAQAAPAETAWTEGTPAPAPDPVEDDGVPAWFKKAQEKAKKPKDESASVQRSRYAEAFDAALSESSSHFEEANETATSGLEAQLQQLQDGIREVKAPQISRVDVVPADGSAPAPAAEAASPDVTQEIAPVSTADAAAPQATAEGAAATDVPAADSAAAQAAQAAPTEAAAAPSASAPMPAFRPEEIPALAQADFDIPSFLDPAKTQGIAVSQQPPRGEDRVAVPFDPTAIADAAAQHPADEAAQPADAAAGEAPAKRQPIVLPDIGTAANLAPVEELQKQRAPLAEGGTAGGGKSAAKSLLSMLPSITGSIKAQTPDEPATPHPTLSRNDIPSLSGAITRPDSPADAADEAAAPEADDAQATAFMPPAAGTAGMTGAFAAVDDELLQNVDEDDIYVDDADDSVYEESFTESGAFAGPGYVEMPKSRAGRLFDRFRRKKKKDDEPAPSEWLGVDEEFDARSVGAARGGWESFRPEDDDTLPVDDGYQEEFVDEDYEEFDEFDDDGFTEPPSQAFPSSEGRRPWNGGAFSLRRAKRGQAVPEDDFVEDDEFIEDDGMEDEGSMMDMDGMAGLPDAHAARPRRGARVRESFEPMDYAPEPEPQETAGEIQQIYRFRHPDVNTEVWFVALGSELAGHAGMRAFMEEHAQDLRGAVIVELDALGAGDLSFIEQEGAYRKTKASSRMKRYIKKATQATGTAVGTADILWGDSAASYATSHGMQAMHLVGMEGTKPAYFAQGNDVLENVDAELLAERADYVMELLKNI